MSKITKDRKYPRVTERIELSDYHPALKGDYIEVWVNISRGLRNRLLEGQQESLAIAQLPLSEEEEREARTDALINAMKDCHAEWWGLPREDVDYLYDQDVALYQWIVGCAIDARSTYEEDRKNVEKG